MADDLGALVSQVKEANDIVDVVGGYVNLRQTGQTYKGLCPFHEDHHPSFDVDPRRQRYRCWACQKHGDVITFIREQERVDFREALEILARRAGITLEKSPQSQQNRGRALMLDVVRWAAELYQQCLLDSPLAEGARHYLGERRLSGETVRKFGLGFAPPSGSWLAQHAGRNGMSMELLEKVGLIAPRPEGNGFYDRFRDRVMFPIRDARGLTVGFGGRILPTSPFADRAPKYYNSCDTPLFAKSELLYGLDLARKAAGSTGYLAVVEGYTDVMMAHQMGLPQVVATMGTALNARHVQQLRRHVPRVILVFDADAGGDTGVDRALQIFVSQELDLGIATLPEGLDPCDMLIEQGADALRQVIESAVDALEFKLGQVLKDVGSLGVEGKRRALESVLSVIALAPDMPGKGAAIRRELIVTFIAQRLAVKEDTIWARLQELRERARQAADPVRFKENGSAEVRAAPAPAMEKELLIVLLADPALVPLAAAQIGVEQMEHPGLRRMLASLYSLEAEGQEPTLDNLRPSLDEPRLEALALEWQELGSTYRDRPECLRDIVAEFERKRHREPQQQELKNQLQATSDHATALELLRRLQGPIEN